MTGPAVVISRLSNSVVIRQIVVAEGAPVLLQVRLGYRPNAAANQLQLMAHLSR